MTKNGIIEEIARERIVERMVMNISHSRTLSQDLQDLSQMALLTLLEYREEIIVSLWENGEMNFFLARIILTQLHSPRSGYNYLFHRGRNVDADIADLPSVYRIADDETQ